MTIEEIDSALRRLRVAGESISANLLEIELEVQAVSAAASAAA